MIFKRYSSEALNFRITDLPNATTWYLRFFSTAYFSRPISCFKRMGKIHKCNPRNSNNNRGNRTCGVVISDKVLFNVTFHTFVATNINNLYLRGITWFRSFFITQSKYSLITFLLSVYFQRSCVREIPSYFLIFCLQICDFDVSRNFIRRCSKKCHKSLRDVITYPLYVYCICRNSIDSIVLDCSRYK